MNFKTFYEVVLTSNTAGQIQFENFEQERPESKACLGHYQV